MSEQEASAIPSPIELLRIIREESWLDIPPKDNSEQRSRCNDLIVWMDETLDSYDTRQATYLSDEALAGALQADTPSVFHIREAARRLTPAALPGTDKENHQ